jgi:hypothetical protein
VLEQTGIGHGLQMEPCLFPLANLAGFDIADGAMPLGMQPYLMPCDLD